MPVVVWGSHSSLGLGVHRQGLTKSITPATIDVQSLYTALGHVVSQSVGERQVPRAG
jgi:hypothetical protein